MYIVLTANSTSLISGPVDGKLIPYANKSFSTNVLSSLILVNELNTAQADFDANQFKTVLDAVIRQLDLPELKLEIGDPTRKISQNFSGQVRSSNDMQKLKQALHQSLQEVFKLLNEQFKASAKQIELNLIDTQNQLAQKMTQGLEKELEQIKQDFAEKQKAVQEYEALKALISDQTLTKKIA